MMLLLAIFAGLLPTYLVRFSFGPLPLTLLDVLFFALFAVWYWREGRKPGAWHALTEWAGPIALLLTAATIGMFVSGDPRAAAGLWRVQFVEPLLFFVMFVQVVSKRRKGTWVLVSLAACMAIIGLSAIFQKNTGYGIPNPVWQAAGTRRVTSFYGFPNAIALFCAPVVVLCTGWSLAMARRARIAADWGKAILPMLAAALGVCAIVFAVSEGGMIAVAAGLLAIGLFDKKLRPFALGAVIFACVAVLLWPPFMTYATDILSFRDDSSSVRGIIWNETAHMLADQPVFGAGLSGYPTGILPYHNAYWIEVFQYPHNALLNVWSELGLLGVGAFVWILVRFFRKAWAARKDGGWVVPTVAAAMVALLVHGLVDVPYFKNDLAMLFWLLVGMIECARPQTVSTK